MAKCGGMPCPCKQDAATPFEQFEDLARQLFAVPKRELDEWLVGERDRKQGTHAITTDGAQTSASDESAWSDASHSSSS